MPLNNYFLHKPKLIHVRNKFHINKSKHRKINQQNTIRNEISFLITVQLGKEPQYSKVILKVYQKVVNELEESAKI